MAGIQEGDHRTWLESGKVTKEHGWSPGRGPWNVMGIQEGTTEHGLSPGRGPCKLTGGEA